jgi:hypothetical protein
MTARQPPPGYRRAKPVVWMKAIRPVSLGAGGFGVACALALYADKENGANACPGLSRLEWASGASRHTVVSTLEKLEAMWLLYCSSKSTGRGHASVYNLAVHSEIAEYGTAFEDWQRERRPADRKPKGCASEPFDPWAEGFPREPIAAVKGSRATAKGFPASSQRVPGGTAPVPTREKITSSVLTDGRGLRLADDDSDYEIESDLDDLEGLEDELSDLLFADAVEMSTITGMLQAGSHPRAIINKIRADRR